MVSTTGNGLIPGLLVGVLVLLTYLANHQVLISVTCTIQVFEFFIYINLFLKFSEQTMIRKDTTCPRRGGRELVFYCFLSGLSFHRIPAPQLEKCFVCLFISVFNFFLSFIKYQKSAEGFVLFCFL